ncbi:thermonuclease family protein [Desulfogranum marinum]|uniref:thermonuclease family protein n=1 Tax=Desulfogranum marinum TaxID=453220 RepID=UPI0029C7ACEC|nr:thermonuclease family protein [Desulfogranum marinum]
MKYLHGTVLSITKQPLIYLIPSLLIYTLCLLAAPQACAYTAKVIGVADGDTIKVQRSNGKQVKIRLYGIDTPEKKQAYGNQAKKLTNKLVRGKTVDVKPIDTDRYGRTVGLVKVNGKSVNKRLIQDGLAWVYTKYCRKSFCSSWKSIENNARLQKRGMWNDLDITPPWEWRKAQRQGGGSKKVATTKPIVAGQYHGNVNSLKFHRPGCRSYNCKNCTAGFASRETAIRAGYKPCGICRP